MNKLLIQFTVCLFFSVGIINAGTSSNKLKNSNPDLISCLENFSDQVIIGVFTQYSEDGKVYLVERSISESSTALKNLDSEKAKMLRERMCDALMELFAPAEIKKVVKELHPTNEEHKRLFWIKTLLYIAEDRYVLL